MNTGTIRKWNGENGLLWPDVVPEPNGGIVSFSMTAVKRPHRAAVREGSRVGFEFGVTIHEAQRVWPLSTPQ